MTAITTSTVTGLVAVWRAGTVQVRAQTAVLHGPRDHELVAEFDCDDPGRIATDLAPYGLTPHGEWWREDENEQRIRLTSA